MRCSMTDREYPEFSDGVWDDGEWISWDWINQHLHRKELGEQYPHASPELVEVFESLVDAAASYKALTGHYLQIWGELGELFAEIKFGLKRHRPHTATRTGSLWRAHTRRAADQERQISIDNGLCWSNLRIRAPRVLTGTRPDSRVRN